MHLSLIDIVELIVILSGLVVAHEWGHFVVARIFKIRVDDFSIGFGKRLIRIGKLGDTEYNLRMLPLGGFVKIAGMDPDEEPINRAKDIVAKKTGDDDPDAAEIPLAAENTGEGSAYNGPDGFNAKPLWQRSLVILGGPVMSFVTGWLILCLMGCTFGLPIGKALNRVVEVQADGEGHRIGLRAGDSITAINGNPVTTGLQMIDIIHNSLGKPIVLTISRDGKAITLPSATPRPNMDPETGKPVFEFDVTDPGPLASLGLKAGDQIGTVNDKPYTTVAQLQKLLTQSAGKSGKIDITRGEDDKTLKGKLPADIAAHMPGINAHEYGILNFQFDHELKRSGFWKSVKDGTSMSLGFFSQIADLIRSNQIQKSAGGLVAMASMTSIAQHDGPYYVFSMAASISLSLALFNILPIPILDGGHLLAFFIEWVRRGRRMSPQVQQAFMLTGLAIIVLLVVLINGKNIWILIHHNVPQ